jgi:hypothetical protein
VERNRGREASAVGEFVRKLTAASSEFTASAR